MAVLAVAAWYDSPALQHGLIKKEQITTMEELIEKAGVGDKCESCIEDGYENDGYSLAMVLSLVRQGRL